MKLVTYFQFNFTFISTTALFNLHPNPFKRYMLSPLHFILYRMYLESIKERQDTQYHWISNPVIECNNGDDIVKIELCQAVEENACQPVGAVNQPPYLGPQSTFRFDKNQFKGIEAKNDIIKVLRDSCPNCTLFLQDYGKGIRTRNSFCLDVIIIPRFTRFLQNIPMIKNCPKTTLFHTHQRKLHPKVRIPGQR